MERVGDRYGKMERYCSTGRSPQRAVAPMEEEEEEGGGGQNFICIQDGMGQLKD
jgi:hypothetical protein